MGSLSAFLNLAIFNLFSWLACPGDAGGGGVRNPESEVLERLFDLATVKGRSSSSGAVCSFLISFCLLTATIFLLGDLDLPSSLDSLAAMRSFFLCSSEGRYEFGGDEDEADIGDAGGGVAASGGGPDAAVPGAMGGGMTFGGELSMEALDSSINCCTGTGAGGGCASGGLRAKREWCWLKGDA